MKIFDVDHVKRLVQSGREPLLAEIKKLEAKLLIVAQPEDVALEWVYDESEGPATTAWVHWGMLTLRIEQDECGMWLWLLGFYDRRGPKAHYALEDAKTLEDAMRLTGKAFNALLRGEKE